MAKKLLNMKVLKTAVRVLFFLSIACFSSGLMMTKDNQWEIGGSKDPYDNGGYYGDSQGGGADIGAPSSAGVVYELSADGSYALVISYTGNATHVGVDATYQGKPVTTIYKDAFYNNDTIVAVTLPEGVTTIHNAAFNGCWRLTTINLPASVTDIGPSAFPSELLTSYNNCLYMGASGIRTLH